ncbi:MAG: hypothetical protein RR315_02905, partial [Oscillospiraceae bacterium]
MSKFRKIVALTLALSMCLLTIGCGGKTDEPAKPTDSAAPSAATSEAPKDSSAPTTAGAKIIKYSVLDDCPTIDPQL